MFDTVYTYKIAILPFPTVFITAFSEIQTTLISQALSNILSDVLELMDKAQKKYKAVFVLNEPTATTHNLNMNNSKNAVAVYCSLKFQSLKDMNEFLATEIKLEQ